MGSLLSKLDKAIIALLKFVVIVASIVVTVLILYIIVERFFLGSSTVGVLELATLSAIWLYMCGAIVAARNKEHLVVDFLAHSLTTDKARALHNLAVSVIMVVLSIFFIRLANDMVGWSLKRPQTTAALSLPLLIPQTAIVMASVFCFIYAVRDLVKAIIAFKHSSANVENANVENTTNS